jgi:Uma2 family endonuclease
MIRAGILQEGDPVELLEGWIRVKIPRNPRHDAVIDKTQRALLARFPDWRARVQSAITTADSEPEPDVVLAPGPADRYSTHHPSPDEIALVIEVADSSLEFDREEKSRVYARAGIPIYWIINLRDSTIEVYSAPTSDQRVSSYQRKDVYTIHDSAPLSVPGMAATSIPVQELL